ncbi:MAG TPA: hypothetical protein VHR66_10175 [Gemmataceae bacterium]|jgi:hypothetical protein|nr:hypothetical protein [Gemmataceae bacterium]
MPRRTWSGGRLALVVFVTVGLAVAARAQERPGVLNRPLDPEPPADTAGRAFILPTTQLDPPLGFTGPSGIVPRSGSNAEYQTVEDRWRIGFPYWDRYGQGFPPGKDYPYRLGDVTNPYTQNVLKGDYPIIGQHTFLNITGTATSLVEARMIPTATTPFESTLRDRPTDFFGKSGQFVFNQLASVSVDLSQGDAAFKPADWRLKITPVFNYNHLSVQELGVVSPDVTDGTKRYRGWDTVQEWFGEVKLADLSPEYDFVSIRAGSQPFTSDFRGLIFSDTNAGVRIFGNYEGNRDQFNLAVFRQLEKDVNSGLNSFHFRDQTIAVANFYRQDCVFPGYTSELSVLYNNDGPSFLYDRNKFLVRPDPAGVAQPHRVQTLYLGWAGDGHIDRFNISHAAYWVIGRDDLNPIANREVDISGQMAFLELSYDRDWIRFRASGVWASGDGDPSNHAATGFDTILDNPNFAGGEFSYWQRQQIPLFGVNISQRGSFIPDLRSSKIQGQSNFVNPGLWLVNAGIDFDITPSLRSINNANYLWFDKTAVLRQFLFQGGIDREIGVDLSSGIEYRPLLNNNVILLLGASALVPSNGFRQLYNRFRSDRTILAAGFFELTLTY